MPHCTCAAARPCRLRGFFDGLTNILFTFGGHFMLLEVLGRMQRPFNCTQIVAYFCTMTASWPLRNVRFLSCLLFVLLQVLDSMYRPAKFHKVFACSYSYVITLTIPNSVRTKLCTMKRISVHAQAHTHCDPCSIHVALQRAACTMLSHSILFYVMSAAVQVLTYWAFPAETVAFGNAFAVYPASAYRTTAIILMIGHQMIAFSLFILPVRPALQSQSASGCSDSGALAPCHWPPASGCAQLTWCESCWSLSVRSKSHASPEIKMIAILR